MAIKLPVRARVKSITCWYYVKISSNTRYYIGSSLDKSYLYSIAEKIDNKKYGLTEPPKIRKYISYSFSKIYSENDEYIGDELFEYFRQKHHEKKNKIIHIAKFCKPDFRQYPKLTWLHSLSVFIRSTKPITDPSGKTKLLIEVITYSNRYVAEICNNELVFYSKKFRKSRIKALEEFLIAHSIIKTN